MVKQIEDLAFVLDVVDLLGFEDLHLFEDLSCEELAGLLLFN